MSEVVLDLSMKVAIVTGGGRGLGRLYALELARRGARVVVNDLGGTVEGGGSDAGPAQSVVDEIIAAGGIAVADNHSVLDGEAVVATAVDAFGTVDILINNAGILRDGALHKAPIEELELVLDVHLRGALRVTRAAWQYLRTNEGNVVFITSAAGLFGNFGQAGYGGAKGGMYGLMRVLAVEGVRSKVTVNAVAPVAYTRMTEPLFSALGFTEDHFPADAIVPVVVALTHEDWPTTGLVFTAGGNHVGNVFMGVTQGHNFESGFTAEMFLANLEEVLDREGYGVPASLEEELQFTLDSLAAAA